MKINNLDFNMQISGEGTPFIWAHGLMSSMEGEDMLDWFDWQNFPKNIKLIRYDARGHGKSQGSEKPEDYHWRNLGKDMLAVGEAVGAKQFIAGGTSMGCATTIYAALQAPERMKAILLVTPPTGWETRAAQGKLYKQFAMIGGLLGGKGLAKMMSGNMARMLPAWMVESKPEMFTGMVEGMNALKRKTMWNVMRGAAVTDMPPREEFKALVDIPTIILAWVGDPTHPTSTAEELHRLLPKSDLFIAQGYEEFKTIPQRLKDFVLKYA